MGCRSFGDIRARSKDFKGIHPTERSSAQLIGKWRRCHPEMSDSWLASPTLPELNDREKAFCLDVGFSHWQFAVLRDRLLREAEEHEGRFSKTLVRSFFRLDSTQAIKLFEFFVGEGKITNADKDPKETKSIQPTIKKETPKPPSTEMTPSDAQCSM